MAGKCLWAPASERNLLSLREMLHRRENPNFLFSLLLLFQYSYTALQVFSVVQSLAGGLKQSVHHSSFTFPGTKPSCVAVACPCSAQSPAALELCLIGIWSFVDRSIPVQSFHPTVQWDLYKNNLTPFLEIPTLKQILNKKEQSRAPKKSLTEPAEN